MAHKGIGEILKEMDLVTEVEIDEALDLQRREGGLLGTILVEMGYITEKDLLFAVGAQSGMSVVDPEDTDVPIEVIELVPADYCETYGICPLSFENGVLTVALSNPMNVSVLDDLRFLLSCEVTGAVATAESIDQAIRRYYAGQTGDSLEDVLAELGAEDVMQVEEGTAYSLEDIEKQANSTPVVKLLNMILLQAIRDRASDVHIEPFEDELKVRYRIDGVLYELMPPPKRLAPALASRVKVMSKLDISETRLPQDGRIELTIGGRPVDLRVSTLPTMFGESVVMRVLDRSNVSLDMGKLGMRPNDLETVRALLAKPNGIVLVTGPTGSGKTTTLYSCLNDINSIDAKIITTEDPVEYDLEGIVQVQVNEEIGLGYSHCLRSILRQDPDVILVGEIRDLETSQIAIEAALTGHLVLSTLHTNDAPSVITRMLDLGVPTYLLAATLEAAVAQRLVRKVCNDCKRAYEPADDELYELDIDPATIAGKTFYYGEGCKRCNGSGYRGRLALYEIMLMNEQIRHLILKGASTGDIREAAREQGMRVLREAGVLAIYDGYTTIEEVVRETVFT